MTVTGYRTLLEGFLSQGASLQAAGASAVQPARHDLLAQLLRVQLQMGALGLHVFTHNMGLSSDPPPPADAQAAERHLGQVMVSRLV